MKTLYFNMKRLFTRVVPSSNVKSEEWDHRAATESEAAIKADRGEHPYYQDHHPCVHKGEIAKMYHRRVMRLRHNEDSLYKPRE